jgi:hypothetical protein
LTALLTASNALTAGSVAAVTVRESDSTWAHLTRVTVSYDDDARGERPMHLLLKHCRGAVAATPSEVEYYVRDYVGVHDAPLPHCYGAHYDGRSREYWILLEDLERSHRDGWAGSPGPGYGFRLADALAALHAPHWGERASDSQRDIERFFTHVRSGLEPLLAASGRELTRRRRDVLRRLFDEHPARLLRRAHDPAGWTLIHGDVNPGNVLRRRDGRGGVLLIDRQPFEWSLTHGLGVSDLSTAIVHWWPTPLRRACERPLLRRYHRALLRRGVRGYDLPQLYADYADCLAFSVYVAVEWCSASDDVERMRWLWRAQLARALQAIEDW